MKSKENYIIEECRHCGNKTKLDIMGKYTEYGDPEYDYGWVRDWLLLKCCACGKACRVQFFAPKIVGSL